MKASNRPGSQRFPPPRKAAGIFSIAGMGWPQTLDRCGRLKTAEGPAAARRRQKFSKSRTLAFYEIRIQ
jgi:hypothetical protein